MIIYLFVKQHQRTKLKYFGKTARSNPEKYKGSGIYWKRHLKKHGNKVDTLCLWEFNDEIECNQFALKFSEENDIIKSEQWANLIIENGLDGAPPGENHPMFNRRGEDHPSFGKKRPDASERMKGEKNPSFGLIGKNHPTSGKRSKPSDETRKLWSKQRRGKGNPMYGTKRPDTVERNQKRRDEKRNLPVPKSSQLISQLAS